MRRAPISVREATRDDIPALARLKATVARRAYEAAHAGPGLEQWLAHSAGEEHFRYRIGRSGYHVMVATDSEGEIVGVATIRQRGRRADGNAGGLYVLHPGQGIGRALQRRREQLALELGCTRMRLSTFRTNTRARAFIAKQGYERVPGRSYREKTLGVMVDTFEADLPIARQS